MQFKLLIEELSKESKTQFRELMHKFHPDKGEKDTKIAQEILKAKEKNDEQKIKELHKKYFGGSKSEEKISLNDLTNWAREITSKLLKKHNFFIHATESMGKRVINFKSNNRDFYIMNLDKVKTKKDLEEKARKTFKREGLI
ncbi:MAG: hypothetical protein K9L57_06010 [Spirochaetaceae bacterium]|nr:hypothetical protein [Spirochaetaceae bacterium]